MMYFNFNNKAGRFFFIAAVCLLISSCRKKEYPANNSETTPAFYFTGEVDGKAQNMRAGIDNYYMYASYKQDTNNVYQFIGDLRKQNCTNCTNSIQFQINNYEVSASSGTVNIDSALMTRKYFPIDMPGGSPLGYSVNFTPNPIANNSVQDYVWNFGDGDTSHQKSMIHRYENAGYYNVSLATTFKNGCTSMAENTVKVVNTDVKAVVNITGNTSIIPGDTTTLTAYYNPNCSNLSYNWNIGSTYASITVFPTTTTTYSVTCICNNSGDSDMASVIVQVLPATQTCKSNFNFYLDTSNNANPLSLSNITIRWTDNNGTVYTSKNVAQPNDSYVQVISAKPYYKNELNQTTMQLHVKFQCRVYNGNNFLQINNGDAVIAVAYK